MSEKILLTLMQLFAIIARPHTNDAERRGIVEAFLRRLLNQELLNKYLSVYDNAYEEARKKLEKRSAERREGAIAIRIRKLCNEIIEQRQLDQEQRIIVVIQALEFCKSGNEQPDIIELGFIDTLAEGLLIPREEYEIIERFVLSSFNEPPLSQNLLIISGDRHFSKPTVKHAFKELLKGQIWILFVPSVEKYFLRFSGTGELTMNGQLLHENKVYPFSTGSSLKGYNISPVYYWDVTMQFLSDEFRSSRVVYEVKNLEYRFRTRHVGIHHMSFSGESGRMIGIMGASGAGKTTLLSVLNGTNEPSDGEVLINGISIHREKEKIKGLIGYVAQDDLLIEELTVFENLYYNALLCFDNLTHEQIVDRVDNVLRNLGLFEIRNMKVGTPLNKNISGGQRKRLNISLELIREPSILFLDEPTSGLSSRDSENILDLLKELARKGKLLFVVIHQPSSDIFKMFDKLIILDTGGYMIYNGNPIESIEYFKKKIEQANYNASECHVCGNVNPEQIFNIVETKILNENGKPTDIRRITPEDWNRIYLSEKKEEKIEKGGVLPEVNFRTPSKLKQTIIFARRDILTKISDLQYLLITLLEAPVLAFFLAFLIRYYDESARNPHYTLYENSNLPVYIFMSVIVAIFMGLSGSAEEIIKDRKILKRESFLNLSWNSYLMSKVFVQFGISSIQALSFVIAGNLITGIKGMMFEYWLVLFSCWASANIVGLIISDSFKTVVAIYILIPFLVIPQIILSGVLVRFEKLNPGISSPVTIPFYGEVFTARWGYEALAVNQFVYNRYEEKLYVYDKAMSEAKFRKDFWYVEMKGKLDNIQANLKNGESPENISNSLSLVQKEIKKQMKLLPEIRFEGTEYLQPDKVTPGIIASALDYLENIRKYYINYYNRASMLKDSRLTKLEAQIPGGPRKLRDDYFNSALEEFVTNKDETNKIIEFNGELVQKMDPVFMDPVHNFVKAHFYSPVKKIFGVSIDTYIVNTMVLWFFVLVFYLLLYLRVFKRFLEWIEKIHSRRTILFD